MLDRGEASPVSYHSSNLFEQTQENLPGGNQPLSTSCRQLQLLSLQHGLVLAGDNEERKQDFFPLILRSSLPFFPAFPGCSCYGDSSWWEAAHCNAGRGSALLSSCHSPAFQPPDIASLLAESYKKHGFVKHTLLHDPKSALVVKLHLPAGEMCHGHGARKARTHQIGDASSTLPMLGLLHPWCHGQAACCVPLSGSMSSSQLQTPPAPS